MYPRRKPDPFVYVSVLITEEGPDLCSFEAYKSSRYCSPEKQIFWSIRYQYAY